MPADTPTISPTDAIAAHHAEMVAELRRRVDDLLAVVALGEPAQPSAAAIGDYFESTILPHAASEEATLYATAARFEARLVQSLVAEHGTLRRLVSELAAAGEPAGRVATAGAVAELFALHAAKENDFVLPTLLEGAPAELPSLLRSMHEDFERQLRPRVVATLDVRGIPHGARHAQIFGRLEALAAGEALIVVNDHDPVPLRHQLDALRPGGFAWSYEEAGPELWRVLITRREAAPRPPAATSAAPPAVADGHATAEVTQPDVLRGATRLLGRSLRSLAEAGRAEEASRIAADAWALLRDRAPAEAARLSGLMHGLTRSAGVPAGEPPGEHSVAPELDVREDPPARRHQKIFDAFAQLAPGMAFILVNDHDPVPLRYQFAAEHPGEVEWEALEEGPDVWRVRIGRSAQD